MGKVIIVEGVFIYLDTMKILLLIIIVGMFVEYGCTTCSQTGNIRGNVNNRLEIINLELKYLRLSLTWNKDIFMEYRESLSIDLLETDSFLLDDHVKLRSTYEISPLSSVFIILPEISVYLSFFKEHIEKTIEIPQTRKYKRK